MVLIAAASANAVALDVPVWRLAVSLPFAMIANALAITRRTWRQRVGGLVGSVRTWHPLQRSAQWAVVNRILVTGC